MRTLTTGVVVAVSLLLTACVKNDTITSDRLQALHDAACRAAVDAESPWHISRLYDCDSKTLYIPFQLWTGASWDGVKGGACMHKADGRFTVNGDSTTTIKGPLKWKSPKTGVEYEIWSREKVDGPKVQYFTCHDNGIGRVFDNRRDRYYESGRCKFPGGPMWPIKKRRGCVDTTIEIVNVELDEKNELAAIKFKWWVNGRLDHIYRYARDYGMTNAWRQPKIGN